MSLQNLYEKIDSEPGKGTCFKIYFPELSAPHEPFAPTKAGNIVPGGAETILLVDDDMAVAADPRKIWV